jgi:hypothetical protein
MPETVDLHFIGYGHAGSLVYRPGVAKRGKVYTAITDDPCDCHEDHVAIYGVLIAKVPADADDLDGLYPVAFYNPDDPTRCVECDRPTEMTNAEGEALCLQCWILRRRGWVEEQLPGVSWDE